MSIRFASLAPALLGVLLGAPAFAKEQNYALAYAGLLELNQGDTRVYAGGMADVYTDSGLGVHVDAVHLDAVENGTYASLGLSYEIAHGVRPEITIGSSTENRSTLPDLFLRGQIRIKPGTNSGWVFTPAVTYRTFRDGKSETMGELQVVKYFDLPFDRNGYWVVQVGGETTLVSTGAPRASINAGLSTVRKGGVAFGLSGQVGTLFRDPFVGNSFRGRFVAVRPSLELPLGKKFSVVARGEVISTQLTEGVGGMTGLKVKF